MTVSAAFGSPTTTDCAAAFASCSTRPSCAAGTSIRVGALHDCPVFSTRCSTEALTALSRSASSSNRFGDLPPSSWCTRFTVAAAARATSVPARVEPVNETMSICGCEDNAAPTTVPSPLIMLNTPAGTPASCMTSAQIIALKGEYSDGFNTIVQPAARAGTTLAATWLMGQFHGVINAHTPTGSCTSRAGPWRSSNLKFCRTSIMAVMWPMPTPAWELLAMPIGAPISSLIASATSFRRFL